MLGAALGAMLLKTMGVSLSALSVPEFWQQAINGLLLLVAITADRFVLLRRDGRPRRGRRHRRESCRTGPAPDGRGAPTTRARRRGAAMSRVLSWDRSVFVLLLVTVVVGAVIDPDFAGGSNLGFVLQDIGEIMLIALPMTFLIMTGEIDLSVASTAALAGCVLGWAWQASGSMGVAVVAAVGTGVVCGAVNGFLVTRLGLGSLAVTIGTLGLYRGLCYALLGDTPAQPSFRSGRSALDRDCRPPGA